MIILGIETSCDETAAAVLQIKNQKYRILSNIVSSQIDIHKKYGGIVPEVAARKHVEMILPVVEESLTKAMVSSEEIDLIAVTRGPGLITSLLVGIETAKNLAYAWKKPLIDVNHLAGHLYGSQLVADSLQSTVYSKLRKIKFPVLCLIVSGGHTELVLMQNYWDYKVIGKTLDDAAGEAFDKIAKLFGLSYPGGPEISRLARKGNPQAFYFPRPMIDSKDYNFSFSGLKTAVLYRIRKYELPARNASARLPSLRSGVSGQASVAGGGSINLGIIADLAASVEQAIVDVLVDKTIRAAKFFKVKTVMMGGGVSANRKLREAMKLKGQNTVLSVLLPEIGLSTDNGLVIALAGYYKSRKYEVGSMKYGWKKIEVDPNLEL